MTEVCHNFQALCVKEAGITLEFEKVTKVATKIIRDCKIQFLRKKSRTQRLKFENEIKNKENPNLKKKKNEYQKMEEEIVKSLLRKKRISIEKKKKLNMKSQLFKIQWKLKKRKKEKE